MNRLIKYKYQTPLYYLGCLISILFSISNFTNQNTINKIYGIIIFIVVLIALVYKIVIDIVNCQNNHLKIERILYFIIIGCSLIYLFDFLIIGLIKTIIIASNLKTRPTSLDYHLGIRLCYIAIKEYKQILMGVWTTIWLSLLGTVIGLVLGLIFSIIVTMEEKKNENETITFLKKIAKGFVKIYVTIFRGTPMIVQAMIIFYFMPPLLADLFKINQDIINRIFTVNVAGLVTVSLNTTAYLTEVIRGGISSINIGQMEGARSLGMNRRKAMIFIVLPQAIKNSLPSICNEFIINIKDTSVLSVIQVIDLYRAIEIIQGNMSTSDPIFIAAIIYLFLTLSISKILGLIEKKMNIEVKELPSSN